MRFRTWRRPKPIAWFENWTDGNKGVYGFSLLGIVFQAGSTFGNTYPTIGVDTRNSRIGLTILEIRLPSLTRREYANGQWGSTPHWFRPLRETTIYFRHGQRVKDRQGKEYYAWCIDLGKSEHIFDVIKLWLGIGSGSVRSGIYPLFWKLSYHRKNNNECPYDTDELWWGNHCILREFD